jgi:hypothetical protein
MPRDLGKAKRADLTGKFPGEQAEYGSALARFLEGAGQLRPLAEGTYLDASGNGHGKQTEVPRSRTDTGRGKDTEVAPMPGGNGRHDQTEGFGADTVFETSFGQEDMFAEQTLSLEPALSPVEGPALSPEPMLEPAPLEARAEPQSLDSVPDLLSPELDEPVEEPEDETQQPQARAKTQDLPPPAHSEDTGMLIAEAFSTREEDGWQGARIDDDDEVDDQRITDKLSRRPEGDEDLTKVFTDKAAHDEDKITNKVEPKRDVDPRAADPNAVVRDTVNFYNQTQNFQQQRKGSGGFPTISPNVVNSGQPLGLRDDTERAPQRDDDTDMLVPEAAAPASLEAEPTLDAVEEAALNPEPAATFGPDEEPTLSDLSELTAEADLDEADKRETDKFTQEDREPPQLPLPEGTDKLDKSDAPKPKVAKAKGVEKLEPLADEKVAAGRDTQRFYVAEILAKKPAASDSTDELQPAEEGPPKVRAKSTGETSSDYSTDSAPPARRRPVERPAAAKPLPKPIEVNTDFIEHVHVSASERIVPELDEDEDGDDTVDEEATAEDRITDRLSDRRPAVPAPARAAASASARERKVSDSLSRRLELERAETLRLIEQAEAVALRLREASSASQGELAAISARRETARASRAELSARAAAAETVFEEPLSVITAPPEPPIEPPEPLAERETAEIAARPERSRVADRVPTRAIGEIVNELQASAARAPASLSELLDQVSRRKEPVNGNGNGDHSEPEDIDLLVAASSRLRETIESAREFERDEPEEEPAPEPPRKAAESTLAGDLDRLWQVLDSRRATAVTTTREQPVIEPATLLIPAADKARITPRGIEPVQPVEDGWTQEMLWPTLAGIAVVTFLLGAVFVWVLVRALG